MFMKYTLYIGPYFTLTQEYVYITESIVDTHRKFHHLMYKDLHTFILKKVFLYIFFMDMLLI